MEAPDKLDLRNDKDRQWLGDNRLTVTLDGKLLQGVVAYDVKKGTVVRHKELKEPPSPGDYRPLWEMLRGKVSVDFA